jgi:hypothetical protein
MRLIGKGYDHMCVVHFASHRRTVFAIQRDVENASAEFLGHFCLQNQTFAHSGL